MRNEKGKELQLNQSFESLLCIGYFSCSPTNVVIFDQLLFVQENGRVNVMSFQVISSYFSSKIILFVSKGNLSTIAFVRSE